MSGNSSVLRVFESRNAVWDVGGQAWVAETQPGGSGGGAVTIADGADVTQGAKADAAWVAGDGTVISLLKKIASAGGSAVSISDGSDATQGAIADAAVVTDTTGTLSGKLRGLVKWAFERMPASLGQKTMAASLPIVLASDQSGVPVTGTFWQATQPVSGTFWQATQPVSGTVTANAGTNLNTSALNLEATQALIKAKTDNLDTTLSSRLKPADTLTGVTTVAAVTSITNTVTVAGGKTNNNAAPGATNEGTLPAVATAATPSYTEGNQVSLSTNLSGGMRITGAVTAQVTGVKSNNALAPDSLNVGALVAVANAAAPTYIEGNEVLLSTDLTGAVRTQAPIQGATGTGIVGPMVQALVSDSRESYIDATVRPFSLTADGRLRVSATPGDVYIEFFSIAGNPCFELPTLVAADDLWSLGPNGLSWT